MKKIIFFLLTCIVTILLLEGVLWILAVSIPQVGNILSRQPQSNEIPAQIDDDLLGHRPNPNYPEHDQLGFRNKRIPARIDILTLGDSQTYGTGVASQETWPAQLARVLNKEVYNMGYPGYGPTHSLIWLEKAIELKPRVVLEAFYAGNDLYDTFQGLYKYHQFPEFKNKDSKVVKMVEAREEQKAFKNEVDLLAPHLDETGEVPVEEEEVYVSPHGFLREMIAGYSKIYGVIRAAKRAVKHYKNQQKDLANRANWDLIRQEAIDRPQKRLVPVYDDQVKTLLTPDYRLAPLNLDDPRVQEGLQGSLLALKQMQTRLNQAGIAFQVVLIPTKELVFKEKALQANQTTDSMLYLFSLEERFWQEVKAYLTQNQIPYVDLLPVLRLQTNAGFQLYPLDWDGHPNPDGYRFMAEYIASQMP